MSRGGPAHRGGELKQTTQRPLMREISSAEGRTRRSRQQLALFMKGFSLTDSGCQARRSVKSELSAHRVPQ